jgi:hypothetical protein
MAQPAQTFDRGGYFPSLSAKQWKGLGGNHLKVSRMWKGSDKRELGANFAGNSRMM